MRTFFDLLVKSFCFCALVFFAGCGDNGGPAPATVKVGGTITYADGAWPHPAKLSFVPVVTGAGGELRSTQATAALDGKFAAETFAAADGLVPGTYKVAVQCWDHDPADGPGAINFVPPKFQSHETSGLEVKVPVGGPEVIVNWDVPKS